MLSFHGLPSPGTSHSRSAAPVLRRACACGGTPGPTGECEACRKKRLGLQRFAASTGPAVAPPIVHDVLRSPGRPLDPATRAEMEPRFGHSFADVRVHADGRAARSAEAVAARAYTVGRDVVFAAGRYAPASAEGRGLLAHELAHVVQQASGRSRLQAAPVKTGAREDADEVAARRAEESVSGVGQGAGGPKPVECGPLDIFTELVLPIPFPNQYFRGSEFKTSGEWHSERKAAKKDKCVARGVFKGVNLSWNLGNPKLGTYWLMELNQRTLKFDLDTTLVYARSPCCACFAGTAAWSLDVAVQKTKAGKVEKGKTAAPLKGSKASAACGGTRCCDVKQILDLSLSLVTPENEVETSIDGKVVLVGGMFQT